MRFVEEEKVMAFSQRDEASAKRNIAPRNANRQRLSIWHHRQQSDLYEIDLGDGIQH